MYGYQITTPYPNMERTKTQKSVWRQAVDLNIFVLRVIKPSVNGHVNMMFEIQVRRIVNA